MLAQAPGLLLRPPAPTLLMLGTFRPDIAAALPSPLQLNIGTFTITDASSIISQANGQLSIVGTAGALSGALASASLARSAGLAVLFAVRRTTTQALSKFGLASSAAIPSAPYAGFDLSSATNPRVNATAATVANIGETISNNAYWEAGVILRSTGYFLVMRDSPSSPWLLAFVSAIGSTAVWPVVSAGAAAHSFAVRNIRALQLTGPWSASDYGIATARIATTVANDTIAGSAFGLFEHTITAATGVTQELSFRYTSDNDRWLIRLDQAGGTVKLIEVVGGVETVRGAGTATLVQTNGTAYRVLVQARPSTTAGQDTITVVTQTGAAAEVFKDTYTGAATGRNTGTLKVSRAGTNLIAWPRGIPMLETVA